MIVVLFKQLAYKLSKKKKKNIQQGDIFKYCLTEQELKDSLFN